jgi:integrase/recombinase XerD
LNETPRDIRAIRLPTWGRVPSDPGVVPWLVFDEEGRAVPPVHRFLIDFVARDIRTGSVRSYAYDLLRWWRWLRVTEVEWDRATSAEVRDFVLWMSIAAKPRTFADRVGGDRGYHEPDHPQALPGRPVQAADHPSQQRGAAQLLRRLDRGRRRSAGEPRAAGPDRQAPAARSPQPARALPGRGAAALQPHVPRRRPRQMPDERWNELFAALRSNRDRAILATAVSNGARAAELLGLRGVDLDWGDQLVRVVRKGSHVEQWLPASAEAFVEGLQTNLNAAKAKLAGLNRAPADGRPQLVALGMPTFTDTPTRPRTGSPDQ